MSQILHKEYDFTQPGGFPLTQDRLKNMQEATGEAVRALIATAGDTTGPIILSGMITTTPSPGTYAVTDGWFIYNGSIIKFTGGSVTPAGGEVPLVEITNTANTLVYYNFSEPPVEFINTATVVAGTTLTDTTHFPLADAVEWGVALGITHRNGGWIEIETEEPSVFATATVRYKHDRIANTLHIRGNITVGDPHAAGGSVGISLGAIPYMPTDFAFLEMLSIPNYVHYGGGIVKTYDEIDYLWSVPIVLNSGGSISAYLIRPDVATAEYRVYFNHVIPLD